MGLPTYSGINCGDIGVEGSEFTSNTDDRYVTERQSLPQEVSTGLNTNRCISDAAWRRYQHLLDKSTPLVLYRWILLAAIAALYALRVYVVEGFYIITYGLGIYILQLLIAFLSPQVDPEIEGLAEGPSLPTRSSDEFRPFVRRLPEFKFWHSLMKAFLIAFLLTFFSAFDVPVFWPVLVFYWSALFVLTMRRQIMHMIKYKYVPFTFGKQRYGKKEAPADETTTGRS